MNSDLANALNALTSTAVVEKFLHARVNERKSEFLANDVDSAYVPTMEHFLALCDKLNTSLSETDALQCEREIRIEFMRLTEGSHLHGPELVEATNMMGNVFCRLSSILIERGHMLVEEALVYLTRSRVLSELHAFETSHSR